MEDANVIWSYNQFLDYEKTIYIKDGYVWMDSASEKTFCLTGVHTSEFNGGSYGSSTPVKPGKRPIKIELFEWKP